MTKEIVLFENEEIKLDVNIKGETVWLSLEQMSNLFNRDKSVISRHIKNVFKEKELEKTSTIAKFATVQKEGNRKITREIDYYNLDMIISVGYRVKSKNGIIFRRWATKIIKEHLIKGYTIDKKRLESIEKTIKLIEIANRMDYETRGKEANEILKVIRKYTKAFELLDSYDRKNIKRLEEINSDIKISYNDCEIIIKEMKEKETSNLFALEKNEGLKSILSDIYMTYNGQDLYNSISEKAANFLYLLVKNHIFIDGNKRIAAALFIYFLSFYNILYKNNKEIIENNTLVALTLLIAESNPKEKEVLIDLIINFLE